MTKQNFDAELRDNAEKRLQASAPVSLGADVDNTPRLTHELQVHQIELEMQNRELQQTRLDLEEALALYTELYDFAPVGYLTLNAEGLISRINITGAKLLGVERASLLQKRFATYVSKRDHDRWNQYFLSCRGDSGKDSTELALQRHDGTIAHVQLDCIRLEVSDDGPAIDAGSSGETAARVSGPQVRIALIDISARKQAEEALIKAGALQRAIFNSANFSSIATDARGVIQIFNVGAEHMLGYAASEVRNRITPADISDPQEIFERAAVLTAEFGTPIAPGFDALVFKASRGIEDIYELTYVRKDGSRLPAVVSVTALRDDQDSIIGYLLIGTDNTARRRVEAERLRLDQALHDKNVELEHAKVVAEKANLAKSEFLSSMSHELRTPLNAILGFAQLIESATPPPTPSQRRSIDQILKAGWYLLALINEVLDLALIESGKLSLSMEPVSVADVLHQCEVMIVPQVEKRGIRVTFPQFTAPCFVFADQTRLKQILFNLLSNAVKYNKSGGTIEVDCRASTAGGLRIAVRDTGPGLAPEQLEQLFQPFNRLGQQNGIIEGTGIGLVVCKRLVEMMGGTIGAESHPGEGSLFWVELNRSNEPALPVSADDGKTPRSISLNGDTPLYTLLYVEDNPANLMLVEDLVARRADIRLVSAKDGTRGVELARTLLPDAILMDIQLPGISGIEALKMLSEDPITGHIPVVALSANAMPHHIQRGLEDGFFRYLTKPIKVNEFMETLDAVLKFSETRGPKQTKRKDPDES